MTKTTKLLQTKMVNCSLCGDEVDPDIGFIEYINPKGREKLAYCDYRCRNRARMLISVVKGYGKMPQILKERDLEFIKKVQERERVLAG